MTVRAMPALYQQRLTYVSCSCATFNTCLMLMIILRVVLSGPHPNLLNNIAPTESFSSSLAVEVSASRLLVSVTRLQFISGDTSHQTPSKILTSSYFPNYGSSTLSQSLPQFPSLSTLNLKLPSYFSSDV